MSLDQQPWQRRTARYEQPERPSYAPRITKEYELPQQGYAPPAPQAFPQRRARAAAQPERRIPTPAAHGVYETEEEDAPQPRYQAAWEPQPVARSRIQRGRRDIEDRTEAEERDERRSRRVRERTPSRMPRLLSFALALMLLVVMGLLASDAMMSAYLKRQQEAREAAYQEVLSKHPLDYRAYIERYAAEYNLQPAYVAAIILNESSFNPSAVSNVGARGLMQLMEDTAEWINGKLNVSGYSFQMMYDPETNIRFGCWYLSYLARMFGGDPVCVTSAYHAGQGTVSNWLQNGQLQRGGGNAAIEAMPEGPTKTYAGRVTRAYGIYDALYYHAFNSAADGAASAAPGADAGG